jgi:hypothetical protein
MKTRAMAWAALVGLAAGLAQAATNDLRIISIAPDTNGYITLTWTSRLGEYYTVYCADVLAQPKQLVILW